MTSYPKRLEMYVDPAGRGAESVDDADLRAVSLLLQLGGVDPTDARFSDPLWLSLAGALRAHVDGHACLELAGQSTTVDLLKALDAIVAEPDDRDEHPRRPFVLDGTRLYVSRSHHEETSIASGLADIARRGQLEVLLGGPGTGKTTRIARRIVEGLVDGSLTETDVALAAPTGKAADRMRQAMLGALDFIDPPADIRNKVAGLRPVTVHRLLGYSPRRREGRYKFGPNRHLPYRLVIVDETSMLSMALMHRLLAALRPGTSLALVGDPDQLVSVDSGSVLGDIARVPKGPVASARKILTETKRFDANSPFGRLVAATRAGDVDAVLSTLDASVLEDGNLVHIDSASDRVRFEVLSKEIEKWATAVRDLAAAGDADAALDRLASVQVLCATRRGAMGADSWNRTVSRWVRGGSNERWYAGRPVMVTRNDYANDLYNGDVGVVVDTGPGGLLVAFRGAEGPRLVSPARLGDVETVHALTIHKSQGSEFDHAIVVVPEESRLLTRELLYTGASRARSRLTVIGSRDAVARAVGTAVGRATGLTDRLAI